MAKPTKLSTLLASLEPCPAAYHEQMIQHCPGALSSMLAELALVLEAEREHLQASYTVAEAARAQLQTALAIVWDYYSSADIPPAMCCRGDCRDEVAALGIDLEAL